MKRRFTWDIIKKFAGEGRDFFSYREVVEAYPDTDKVYLSKVLSRMVDRGMLIKPGRGLYLIVPQDADAAHYLPDWHLVAKYIMHGKDYYIGYYSAMQIHGLITQPALKEIIVTNWQPTSTERIIQGVKFQFVTHTAKRFFGYKNIWINQYDKVMASDLEKTLVDALSRPALCGGMVEIGKAIYESRNKVDTDRLPEYFIRNGSRAAIKRYLFLCELLDIARLPEFEKMMKQKGNSYPLLDTTAPNQGVKNSKFGLKINIDTETIKKSIFT